jgi:arylsulfatase A-like enzyme
MISTTAIESQPAAGKRPNSALMLRRRLGAWDVLALAAWCGLVAGWLEVGMRVLCKSLIGTNRLYMMTRHFVWLIPLSNLLLFFVGGLLLAAATKACPRPFGWLSPRVICAFALMPALLVAGPQIDPWAWLILASGIATRLVPWLERTEVPWRRWLIWGCPSLLSLVLVIAGVIFGGDWIARRREGARPLPPADSPNVLLIVLDTVRADRMSVYGYPRRTTPALEQLAKRAVRFTEARATAPWTLASHASMFSGRWSHELGVEWMTALRNNFPTLAEEIGSRGYATSGFAANIGYCSYDTGLNRGFTHFEDYWADFEHFVPLRTAVLFQGAWDITVFLARLRRDHFLPALEFLAAPYRKDAAMVNRQFTQWLSQRQQPHRPFFAFLNYFDAHVPYVLPQGTPFRFGPGPQTTGDFHLLIGLWEKIDKSSLAPHYRELVHDSYDNCLAYLDGQLGELFETLQSRGVLDNTVVIITSDHGEELGEHGLFEHGESLYRPEIHVPLLVFLPGRGQSSVVVREPVSLRDLPATILDLTGLAGESPFPGQSLAHLWRDSSSRAAPRVTDGDGVISELSTPNPTNPSHGRSPALRGPLISVAVDDYVYIRNQRDGREQLFHTLDDPGELVNLAKMESMQPRLRRFRERLAQVSAHPAQGDR